MGERSRLYRSQPNRPLNSLKCNETGSLEVPWIKGSILVRLYVDSRFSWNLHRTKSNNSRAQDVFIWKNLEYYGAWLINFGLWPRPHSLSEQSDHQVEPKLTWPSRQRSNQSKTIMYTIQNKRKIIKGPPILMSWKPRKDHKNLNKTDRKSSWTKCGRVAYYAHCQCEEGIEEAHCVGRHRHRGWLGPRPTTAAKLGGWFIRVHRS